MVKQLWDLCRDLGFILKIIELILCIVGSHLLTVRDLYDYQDVYSVALTCVAIVGYLVIVACIMFAYIVEDTALTLEFILIGIGCILNFAAGITAFLAYNKFRNVPIGDDLRYALDGTYFIGITTIGCGIAMLLDEAFQIYDVFMEE